jgi:hypothetical protein
MDVTTLTISNGFSKQGNNRNTKKSSGQRYRDRVIVKNAKAVRNGFEDKHNRSSVRSIENSS